MREKYRRRIAIGMAMGAACSLPVLAAPAADPVQARIQGFRELGAAFKNASDELKSATPQVFLLQMSARQMREATRAQYGWFPAGSGPAPGVKTAAKPDIWARPAEFKAAQDNLTNEVNSFARLAATGDVGQLRDQAKAVGRACAACHHSFRLDQR